MTTAAIDCRTPLLALRAAIRAARKSPDLGTLTALSGALLALPTGPLGAWTEDMHWAALRHAEKAQESQLLARIDHMERAAHDLCGVRPSWMPAYAAEVTADVVRLLAVCHERQPDMETNPGSPASRAAEAGTRLLAVILRRTDARPANAVVMAAAAEFAARMRWVVAGAAVTSAAVLAERAAQAYGLFSISGRVPRGRHGRIEWTRRFGGVAYRFELIEPGQDPAAPYGRVDVHQGAPDNVARSVRLSARTRRAVIDRFINSL